MTLHNKSLKYCIDAHGSQVRKYTGDPYWWHPVAVGTLLIEHVLDVDTNMVIAAHLHDVVEDTPTTIDEVGEEFNHDVARLVEWLTDTSRPSDGNRATRKRIDRERLAEAPARAQTIKLADLIHNSKSIIKHDPKFSKVFIAEVQLLLLVLTKGDKVLYSMLQEIVKEYYND